MKRREAYESYCEAVEAGDVTRENAAVMVMLLQDLLYPPSSDGKAIVDLSYMRPSVAKHLGRCGWRWHPEKAKIKFREVREPGVIEDAVEWVPFDSPDDPLEDLDNMSMAEINGLPEPLMVEAKRRLGMLPQAPEPQGKPWSHPNKVTIADGPDTEDDGTKWT